jgi:TRAP transporter 4TM/12TM fusion protein
VSNDQTDVNGGDTTLSSTKIQSIIEEYDPESNFRQLIGVAALLVTVLGVSLSLFHVYTAGFGLLNEIAHRSVHLAFVLGLIFLVFPAKKSRQPRREWIWSLCFAAFYVLLAWDLNDALYVQAGLDSNWPFLIGIVLVAVLTLPLTQLIGEHHRISPRDMLFAVLAAAISLYLLIFFDEIFVQRVGSPIGRDYMMGVLAIVIVMEATRRTMGPSLPVIGAICLLYGMFGPYLPGILGHRGYSILRIVNHLYIGTEGIYGIAVGVVATYVFHFVLFGVLAQRTGVGQLFINLATILAGRYAGGPAKVAVVSSGFFGMISGSPIANTVTTGAFTIPMMKKNGFSPRFAAATEAAASCGGQITPPIMGASAFVMAELLGVPYSEIILIAIVPAALHYFAIMMMIHLEARRLGLSGLSPANIPKFMAVFFSSWHLLIPLVAMVVLLLMQYTPFLAAFWGIILSVVFSYLPLLVRPLGITRLDASSALKPRDLIYALELGAKYALGIGAACACVGFILGITTLTGLGFKFSGAMIQGAEALGGWITAFDVTGMIDRNQVVLFFGLVFTAIACIIMGAGIPTTPTYIILASIVAPALTDFDVPLLVTHFFVFYYGVLADVTPPVALAAYAGAGIAGSEPMRTGLTAFRLSMGKALVPFMFVYAPSLLFVNFSASEFALALSSGLLSLLALSVAYIGRFRGEIGLLGTIGLTIGGLMLVFNNLAAIAIGAVVVLLILGNDYLTYRRRAQ